MPCQGPRRNAGSRGFRTVVGFTLGSQQPRISLLGSERKRVMPSTMADVLAELWPSPMLRGMPEGTVFEHGTEDERIWARLTTPWFPVAAECEITRAETRELAGSLGAGAFVQLCDERLSDLRMRHWLAMFWPDLDDIS